MQRTVLRIVSLTALLVGAIVAVLYGALSQSTASEGPPQPPKLFQSSSTQATGLAVAFEAPEDAADVLPGERVKFRASIENLTNRPQTNLRVGVVVSHHPEALEYVDSSTFVTYGDRTRKSSIADLNRREATLDEPFDPGESVEVEWEMMVSECAARDRWVQVVFQARTDEQDTSHAFKNLYLYPHLSLPTHHFTPSYHIDPQSPAPGDTVRHTVRVMNDGHVALDNVVIHVNSHETIDRYLPTIAANSAYYVVPRRGGEGTPPVLLRPGWSGADTGFNLDFLNPGQTLVLTWADRVASDAPVGTVVRPQVDIRPDQANEWTSVARRLTVSPPANGLLMSIRSIDPEYLAPSYLPGDRVTMRVIVTNHTATTRDDLHVDLELPFALSYVAGSAYLCTDQGDGDDGCDAVYAAPPYQNGNARRLPDAWLDTSASLPVLRPGGTAAITFRVVVLEDALPQQSIALHAALRSASRGDEHRATTRLDIVRLGEIDVSVVPDPTTAEDGDEITYKVSITNTGQTLLTNVAFGVEETCDVRYVPGTLEIRLPNDKTDRDDTFLVDQRRQLRDMSRLIGDLPVWTPHGDLADEESAPKNSVEITLKMQIADDASPGNTAGPRFVVIADDLRIDTDGRVWPGAAGTRNEHPHRIRQETEIEVVESIAEAADSISPFGRGVGWFGEWALSGVLASFVAGLVLPFTLWRVALWLNAYVNARAMVDSRDVPLLMVMGFVNLARSVWAVVVGRAHVRHHLRGRTPSRRSNERNGSKR